MTEPLYIINLAGEKELFSPKKVYRSARRSGATSFLAEKIAKIITNEVYPDMPTTRIFSRIKSLLKQDDPQAALKFSLKESLRKLGPSGFPFEKYIASILTRNGYEVKINQIIGGRCVNYEIDFLAKRDGTIFIGECKYHHLPGTTLDLKVALANHARFLDLSAGGFFKKKEYKNLKLKSILVTNTKFTSQAIQYSQCVGVDLLGWHYPIKKGLEYFIENQKLYPITILPSLKDYLLQIFVSKGLMLVEDILNLDLAKFTECTGVKPNQISSLIKEAELLFKNNSLTKN